MIVYDVIGIGFGPSNMAIAIALEEEVAKQRPNHSARELINALFLEQADEFFWHPGLLLQNADMQISYLKDLVTPRNPCSHFSFINYVHECGRFDHFLNLQCFNPSRIEFNDYLTWANKQLNSWVARGEKVIEVVPHDNHQQSPLIRVITQKNNGEIIERHTKNLITSIGGTPKIPELFAAAQQDKRIFHSHHYLQKIQENASAKKIAIIGAGQSAAEVFKDLSTHDDKRIDLIARTYALKPADETPFVNKIFDSDFVEHLYHLSIEQRQAVLKEFHHANYACIDIDLLHFINRTLYEQSVQNTQNLQLLLRHQIMSLESKPEHITLKLHNLNTGVDVEQAYDAIILATGYERLQHENLLHQLKPYIEDFSVDLSYRLKTKDTFKSSIFILGSNEATHGLSDTLLSLTAKRAGSIANLLLEQCLADKSLAA